MMNDGERQVAETIAGIRRDHKARYWWAAGKLPPKSRVLDFACGVGYGTWILAEAGHRAFGLDNNAEALAYGRRHYANKLASFGQVDGNAPGELGEFDAAVCFETIEHIEDPRPLLKAMRASAPLLIASVPNEDVMPWQMAPGITTAFHFRHYTRAQFEALLAECGWRVVAWHGQEGPESDVAPDVNGRTLIAIAERAEIPPMAVEAKPAPRAAPATRPKELEGKHVAIVGLGPSASQYLYITRVLGNRRKFCDETWAINALGDVFACDRVFHMDDVRIQQIRADAAPESNIAAMLAWMKAHPGPIVTSRAHPDYPGLVEFPLEEVLNAFPLGYFNNTVPYAVAYALWCGVRKISLFGCDYTYPKAHDAERGRACLEFWCGMAAERGVELSAPKTTSLFDACHSQPERFYGYDTLELGIRKIDGRIKIAFTERAVLPSAEEIEANYDHSVHPSPLME